MHYTGNTYTSLLILYILSYTTQSTKCFGYKKNNSKSRRYKLQQNLIKNEYQLSSCAQYNTH